MPRRDDGRKRKLFTSAIAQLTLENSGDLKLCHSCANLRKRSVQCTSRNRRRRANEIDFVGIFALTQRFDHVDRWPPLPARTGFDQSLKVAMQQVCALEANDLNRIQLRQLLPQAGPETLRLDDDARDIANFVGGLRLIAKI